MRSKDLIELITIDYDTDDVKNQTEVKSYRKIYANKLSVGGNEFHSAGQNNIKADIAFRVLSFEYEDESQLRYGEDTYRIYRSAENGDKTNLYCQKVIADG